MPRHALTTVRGWTCLAVLCAGCSTSSTPELPPAAAGPDEVAQALASLEPADRALAARQQNCPVSGEALGSMGTPVKLEHDSQGVLLCCEGCRQQFSKEPTSYLAKIKK